MSLHGYSRGLYPGDSEGKAFARQDVYKQAIMAWRRTGRPRGYAVVLAGDDAMEIELLRDYLEWPAERTLFVDTNLTGLRVVKKLWPEAKTYHGYLRDALEEVDKIGFLNLDFMGHFNDEVERTLQAARGKILPRAVVCYTFYRCREHPTHHSLSRIRAMAAVALSPAQQRDKHLIRWVGSALALQDRLALPNATVLALRPYFSAKSAMGVIALHAL